MSLSGRDDTVVVDTTGWRGEHQARGAEEKYMREAPEAPVLTQERLRSLEGRDLMAAALLSVVSSLPASEDAPDPASLAAKEAQAGIEKVATATASNAGPQGRTLWGRCWVPTPTRNTRVAEPWLPAPEDGRPVEGQRLTPDAPHNGGRPPPPGTVPHHPSGTQHPQGMQANGTVLGPHTHTPAPTACGWRTPTARPVGGQFGEGERLTSDAPHNVGRHPLGNALPPPPQRATLARKGARCGAGAGSQARTDRTRDTRVAEPRLPAQEDGRPVEGQRLTPDAPQKGGRLPPPETAPHHPRGTQPPQGMQAKGTVMGPHTHTPAPAARG